MEQSGAALLQWHERTERELPWKGETDAYRIWVSETMLQQTRASAAAKRYEEFLDAFPDVFALAAADGQSVLALWQGMGYYARARNLHKAAGQVVQRHCGMFPDDEKELRSLAGVGEYTACAVLSMAYGQPVPAVDANLARVISRVFGVHGYVEENRALLREIGTKWLKSCAGHRPGDFNRALMGLGAMVCTAKKAECEKCPICAFCEACTHGEQEILPEKRPKTGRKEEWRALAIAMRGERVLLRRRPEHGMLAGMWEFPHGGADEKSVSAQIALETLAEDGFAAAEHAGEIGRSEFVFTHRVWHLRAWRFELSATEAKEPYLLADRETLLALPMPSVMEPYRKIALRIMDEGK